MEKELTFNNITNNLSVTVRSYVERLKDTPQGTKWHPESDCLVHTKVVFNRALKTEDLNIILAAFFHDLGKVDTTKPNGKGGYSAHEHELVSCDLVKYSRDIIKIFGGNIDIVYWLVKNHMRVKYIDDMSPKKRKSLTDHMWFPLLDKFKPCDQMTTLTVIEVIKANGNPFKYLWNKYRSR